MSQPIVETQEPPASQPIPDLLPVLPLKATVVFPYIIMPLSIGREHSVQAVDRALSENRMILLVSQKDPEEDEPGQDDLHTIGTAAAIMRMLKLPDGSVRILVQGLARVRVRHYSQSDPYLLARVESIEEQQVDASDLRVAALLRNVKENLEKAAGMGRAISAEVLVIAANLDDPGRLADLVTSNLDLKPEESEQILELLDPVARLSRVAELLNREVQLLDMQQQISSQARGEMDKTQREYFLRQQLKAIQQELGEGEDLSSEIEGYRKLAEEKAMPAEAREEMERQIARLERSHPDSAETAMLRTYLEWLTGMPWGHVSEDHLDLDHARKVLDEDHYDLERIKDRILEYLAVRKLNPEKKGPILCFVGPPGVGKTSLGRSIARALGREFVRLSLGGVRDEAEIRGHRRTYVGALPGRILQGLHQAGTNNPVFMLDEIDKIGADYRGDPSSAMLEVLDPEQNDTFQDHYLGVHYDLSHVIFITTANLLEPIQPAFLDRMEVIRISGYTAEEKLHIARRHLIPKQLAEHGLSGKDLVFRAAGLRHLIREYTKEAGVRNLEREIATICRKVAMLVASGKADQKVVITAKNLHEFVGQPRHFSEELLDHDRVGVATGLAWTATGGDLLFIEAIAVGGKGKLLLTGQLGDVMKESAQAALSYAHSLCEADLPEGYFATHDLHIHVPAGSIPKDGPSAGITIATALVSLLTSRPVNRKVAMTGEITLRGDVLPIGGLKEKVLAAREAGIRHVIVPMLNRRDVDELPKEIRKGMTFHFVEHLDEVLDVALRKTPKREPTGEHARSSA